MQKARQNTSLSESSLGLRLPIWKSERLHRLFLVRFEPGTDFKFVAFVGALHLHEQPYRSFYDTVPAALMLHESSRHRKGSQNDLKKLHSSGGFRNRSALEWGVAAAVFCDILTILDALVWVPFFFQFLQAIQNKDYPLINFVDVEQSVILI